MKVKGLTESEKITMKCVWNLGDGTRLAHILAEANGRYGKNGNHRRFLLSWENLY